MDPHEWIRDPADRGEGLTCRWCGLTEAGAEALPRTAATCSWRGQEQWNSTAAAMTADEAFAAAAYDRYLEG